MKTAVVLAAGCGEKMWPYCEYWPKAALPVGGVPNIERLTRQLRSLGFDRIIVAAGYMEKRIKYILDGKEGIEIVSLVSPKGTADSLEAVLPLVMDEQLLVVYGDIVVMDEILRGMVERFRKQPCDALLLAKPIGKERAQDWFCSDVDGDGRVVTIYGHPRPHYVNHRLFGIYAVNKASLNSALRKNPGLMLHVNVGAMPPLQAELEQSLQMMVEEGNRIEVYAISNGAVDLDKPWHLLEANQLVVASEVNRLQTTHIPSSASIHPTAEISGHVMLGEDVTIGRNVRIRGNTLIGPNTIIDNGVIIEGDVIIGSRCKIENYCRIGADTVIGNRNRIGHCAEFQGVTFDDVSFTHYGEVFGVVGTSTDIAAGVTVGILRFDDLQQMQQINGRLETPEAFGNAVYFGDYTRTGIASQYMPGVKIGSNCAIGPAVIVQKDVASRTLLYAEQTLVQKKWGPERYGW